MAALIPQLEIDNVEVGSTRDIQSQIMTQALRKIHYSLSHSHTLIIFVNQVRAALEHGSSVAYSVVLQLALLSMDSLLSRYEQI